MKKRSYIPRNFFRGSRVKDLVPDLKLLLAVLTIGCESHVGVWIPGGVGEDSGLDVSAVAGGLVDLERRGLILRDMDTGEIFLVDFFRGNNFNGLPRHKQALADFRAITSMRLREAVLAAVVASPECGLLADFLRTKDEM